MDFTQFNLHEKVQKGLAEAGYVTAMPVQEQVLKEAFTGRDLYVQSQTGTGKTAAYLIVIFERLMREQALTGRKALIMVPTRELAVQVEDEARILGKYLDFGVASFFGGVGYETQRSALRNNAQILVGTPGRVLDLQASGTMNLADVAFLIIDEADRMFDMGFYPDLRKLINVVPPAEKRQTMLFSATLNAYVKNLAWEYTRTPVEIEIEPEQVTVTEIAQLLYHVPSERKFALLLGILTQENPESAIIFCNTKRWTEIVSRRLHANGFPCEYISGDLPQNKRLAIIDALKAGKMRFLVATDVAARGLDIEGLALVVNYDLPNETENYVHRIGRTARAGKTGKAVSLVSEQDVYELAAIERFIGEKIPSAVPTEDQYAEDKTANERFGGRGRGDGRGGDRRGRDRAYGDRGRGRDNRDRDRNRGPAHAPTQIREDGANRPVRPPERNQGRPFPTDTSRPKPNLGAMSEEERKVYYRTKYGQGGGGDIAIEKRENQTRNEGAAARNEQQGGRNNRRRRGRDNRRGGNANEQRQQQQRSPQGQKPQQQKKPQMQKNPPQQGANKAQQKTAQKKPGILGKILGLFTKK